MSNSASLPKVIAALHLPPFAGAGARSMAWYEDYVLANVVVFVEAGVPAVKIQDQTRETGAASPRTIARMSALARTVRKAHPNLYLGIIVQAHDAVAPIAIADAAGADFVRLKIFVGASVNAEGVRGALGVEATRYRETIGRSDIQILADVHDRTSHQLAPVPNEMAASWAEKGGADGLVLTGSSFEDSLARVEAARAAGVTAPILIGGGITGANVVQALSIADGVVVSTSLMRSEQPADDLIRWDVDSARRLMDLL